ncbi:hypothetical protein D3C81_2144960 [compost metagenome]
MNNIKADHDHYNVVKQLLDAIFGFEEAELPAGAIAWTEMEQIDTAVRNWADSIIIVA